MIFFISGYSFSETCVEPSLSKKMKAADFILSGVVTSRQKDVSDDLYKDDHEMCGPKVARIDVFQAWKGGLSGHVDVQSWDGCDSLGTYFEVGEHYLIFANRDEDNSEVLLDRGGCNTKLLIRALAGKEAKKLDREYTKRSVFRNSEVIGTWVSYDHPNDKPFYNVDSVELKFGKKYKFSGRTFKGDYISKYKGKYYAKSGAIAIYDQDGPQMYQYHLFESVLILTSNDGKVNYNLKKI